MFGVRWEGGREIDVRREDDEVDVAFESVGGVKGGSYRLVARHSNSLDQITRQELGSMFDGKSNGTWPDLRLTGTLLGLRQLSARTFLQWYTRSKDKDLSLIHI